MELVFANAWTLFLVLLTLCHISEGALVSRFRPVRMSSQLLDLTAEKAVDGNLDTDLDRCNCCAATNYERDPWFQIDLQEQHLITDIDVIGPSNLGDGQEYVGLTFYNTNQSSIDRAEKLFNNTDPNRRRRIQLKFRDPRRFRYLTLVLSGPLRLLIVCELQIYGECQDGRFGPVCERCNCQNGPCDKVTGKCPPGGCTTGYTGDKCDTACPTGKYGNDCTQTCGSCVNGSTCNTVTGSCPDCEAGYRPPFCKERCSAGRFGPNCRQACGRCRFGQTCNPVTGACPNGCQPGYLGTSCQTACSSNRWGESCANDCGRCKQNIQCDVTSGRCTQGCQAGYGGAMCITVCAPGRYGEDCRLRCGGCSMGAPCNRMTGVCQGCDPGYLGIFCNRTCTFGKWGYSCLQECGQCEGRVTCNLQTGRCSGRCAPGFLGEFCKQACLPGLYGMNCESTCGNCKNGAVCNVSTGWCPAGCMDGYTGNQCNQAFQEGGLSTTGSIAIGVTLAAVVIITLLIVGLVLFIKKRKANQFHQTQSYTPSTNGVTITSTKDVPDVLRAEQPNGEQNNPKT